MSLLTRRPSAPERSLALRRAVLAASLPPLLAVGWIGRLWGPALLALLVLAGGHAYSWRAAQRDRPNRWVQLAIFAVLHFALAFMFAGLFIGLPVPQAQFALYALAITSFDLRTRRNLFASLGLGLINLYVAATLSRDYSFLVFILAFLALALVIFFRAEVEDGAHGSRLKAQGSHRLTRLHTYTPSFGIWLLGFGILTFLLLPRFSSRPIIPPFSINLPVRGGVTAQVLNP
ncbi:MAG: DUF3488 domain-containing protein, partial [Anaerolineales bacterium]